MIDTGTVRCPVCHQLFVQPRALDTMWPHLDTADNTCPYSGREIGVPA